MSEVARSLSSRDVFEAQGPLAHVRMPDMFSRLQALSMLENPAARASVVAVLGAAAQETDLYRQNSGAYYLAAIAAAALEGVLIYTGDAPADAAA